MVSIAHNVRKISRTRNCPQTHVQLHAVTSGEHCSYCEKYFKDKLPCESTHTGCMNSPDIDHHWIHPRVHLLALLAMSVWQYTT